MLIFYLCFYLFLLIFEHFFDMVNRSVKFETVKKFADSIGAKYCEVSAKDGVGIKEFYFEICKEITLMYQNN